MDNDRGSHGGLLVKAIILDTIMFVFVADVVQIFVLLFRFESHRSSHQLNMTRQHFVTLPHECL